MTAVECVSVPSRLHTCLMYACIGMNDCVVCACVCQCVCVSVLEWLCVSQCQCV